MIHESGRMGPSTNEGRGPWGIRLPLSSIQIIQICQPYVRVLTTDKLQPTEQGVNVGKCLMGIPPSESRPVTQSPSHQVTNYGWRLKGYEMTKILLISRS